MRPPAASWRRSNVHACRPDVLPGMRAARSVFGEIRTLHVDAGDGLVRDAGDDARRGKSSKEVMTVGSARVTPTARMRSSAAQAFDGQFR